MIDLAYPHNRVNLDKPLYMAFLTNPTEDISDMTLDSDTTPEKQNLYRPITSQQGLTRMWLRRYYCIVPGNYTVNDIIHELLTQITNFLQDIKNPRIIFNDNLQKVMFRQESTYAIVCFTDYSVLQLLDFRSKQPQLSHLLNPQ